MSWIQGICPFHIIYIRKVANAIGRQADSSMAKTLDKYHGHKAEWRSLLRYFRGSFRFYTNDWWALHSACLLSGYLWYLVVGKEESLQPETYMQNLLWGWKEQKFRKQVNVKTLQNGVVLSKYTLYTISPFHLLSPCPLCSPQNFVEICLFLFICMSVLLRVYMGIARMPTSYGILK